jgi:hypothetical protein
MKLLRKNTLVLTVTIFLLLVLAFLLVNTTSVPLSAMVCAIGGCDCGVCSNCILEGGRIMMAGIDIVVYGCSCPGVFCQGIAY